MRKFIRFILSTIFITGFIGVLLAGSIRLSLLSRSAWKKALSGSGMYEQMADKLDVFIDERIKSEDVEKLRKAEQSGELSGEKAEQAKKMLAITDSLDEIKAKLKEGEMEVVIEMNIERIFGFLRSKQDDLNLYLPLKDLGMPDELLSQPPFNTMNGEVSLREILSQTSSQESIKGTMDGLKKIQMAVRIVNWVYVGGGIILALILIIYYFLGKGLVKKVKGVSWLLLISGALGVGLVGAIGIAVKKALSNMAQLPEMLQGAIEVMIQRMMGSMKLSSGIVMGVGILGVGVMMYMVKSGKLKVEKEELSDEEKKNKRKKNLNH